MATPKGSGPVLDRAGEATRDTGGRAGFEDIAAITTEGPLNRAVRDGEEGAAGAQHIEDAADQRPVAGPGELAQVAKTDLDHGDIAGTKTESTQLLAELQLTVGRHGLIHAAGRVVEPRKSPTERSQEAIVRIARRYLRRNALQRNGKTPPIRRRIRGLADGINCVAGNFF